MAVGNKGAKRKRGETKGASPTKNAPAVKTPPRPFSEWRTEPSRRDEDAAYGFGYHLILLCRDEALKEVPTDAPAKTRAAIEQAVDTALHNVADMLEGFWPLAVGDEHQIELALQVRVRDKDGSLLETREISPCKLDLPIGYWKWARDREFR